MKKSKVICCIDGCSNAPKSNPQLHFYTFPKISVHTPWRMEKRNLWLQAVRPHVTQRAKNQSSEWTPKHSTVICSAHFVDGEKAEHPLHPAYVPTLFPKQQDIKVKSSARFKRHLRRSLNKENQPLNPQRPRLYLKEKSEAGFKSTGDTNTASPTMKTPAEEPHPLEELQDRMELTDTILTVPPQNMKSMCNIGFQTDILDIGNEVGLNYFLCTLRSEDGWNTAETQVNLQSSNFREPSSPHGRKETKEVACGATQSDAPVCQGFHCYNSVISEEEIHDLCGVSLDVFNLLLKLLPDLRGTSLCKQNKLLLFLLKLKLGLSFTSLGVCFNVHRTTASRAFEVVLQCLAVALSSYIYWPKKEVVQYNLPDTFKEHYKNCRVIIDCTEFKTKTPYPVDARVLTWSEYKHAHTFKVLLGCTPNGFISFKSQCYGGRSSDCFITNDCGFLELLEPNDLILADKGFPHIQTDVENKKAIFVIPPFLRQEQFSVEEVNETYRIAAVRIHIERSIQRIKLFWILRLIPSELFSHMDDILTVICALVNLGPPLIN